ncbi:unnamed protein product [Prorocentrum cordatum]|uniref:peptide-methionine (S)-S-oxide reductase n=1 Tax=Prorocentrum cordatum TaxID=2364126 RepID=A0ABN9VWZ1_9DINO|nr:unnamed protein product [Polarella glacialis]
MTVLGASIPKEAATVIGDMKSAAQSLAQSFKDKRVTISDKTKLSMGIPVTHTPSAVDLGVDATGARRRARPKFRSRVARASARQGKIQKLRRLAGSHKVGWEPLEATRWRRAGAEGPEDYTFLSFGEAGYSDTVLEDFSELLADFEHDCRAAAWRLAAKHPDGEQLADGADLHGIQRELDAFAKSGAMDMWGATVSVIAGGQWAQQRQHEAGYQVKSKLARALDSSSHRLSQCSNRWMCSGCLQIVPRTKLLEFAVGGVALHPSHALREWSRYGLKFCAVCGFAAAADGRNLANPTVCGGDGHTEAVQIEYDPSRVDYRDLLNVYFNNCKGDYRNRGKAQYKNAIWYHSEEQREKALAAAEDLDKGKLGKLEINEAQPWFDAEAYHQKYLARR